MGQAAETESGRIEKSGDDLAVRLKALGLENRAPPQADATLRTASAHFAWAPFGESGLSPVGQGQLDRRRR